MEREYDLQLSRQAGQDADHQWTRRRRWFGRVEKQPVPGENSSSPSTKKSSTLPKGNCKVAMEETHAEAGTVIVQNPHTGEILALANRPTFNPNFLKMADPNSWQNRAVTDVYEPGSTFKVVTLSAALDENLARPDSVIDCQMGSIVVNGLRIHDHKAYGDLTVAQVLANSSDVGAIKLALRLGEERFDHYIRAFGFGSQTGIELPGETRGLTKPVSRWSKVEYRRHLHGTGDWRFSGATGFHDVDHRERWRVRFRRELSRG